MARLFTGVAMGEVGGAGRTGRHLALARGSKRAIHMKI